jgi:hypothetical protein
MCDPDSHETLKQPERWSQLKYVGVQHCDGLPSLELRNCTCGTTLAIELEDGCMEWADRAYEVAEPRRVA